MEKYTHYLEYGKGELLVLLPSNWLTSWSYKSLAEKLAKKYRVIVPDLFRGDSRYKNNALTIDDYVKELHAFLQNLQIDKYYLVGISFSGLIASEYFYQYPSELKKVMLVSTFAPILRRKFSLADGFIGYLKLLYHNVFSWRGIKTNIYWLFDGIFHCLLKHPKQFFLDALIALNHPSNNETTIPVSTKILVAAKDEFIKYDNFITKAKIHNLEAEIVKGYHSWFFLNEQLLEEKIYEYFEK